MEVENRKESRYLDIGRVDVIDICSLPGVLDDISLSGCKVHFPVPVMVDMENDYEVRIRPANQIPMEQLVLICHPQWKNINGVVAQIGFSILRSPDTPQLTAYINHLQKKAEDSDNVQNLLVGSKVTFI